MSNPKIIVVNGLKYIHDENVVETTYMVMIILLE